MKKPSLKFLGWAAALFLCVRALGGTAGSETPATPPVAGIEFTAEERAWMAAHPVIRVGHDPTYPPYAFRDEQGQLSGIDLSYLKLIARRTGLTFQNETRGTWTQMMAAFQAGEVDMLMSLGYTQEREAFMRFSHPYIVSPAVVVMRTDSEFLFDPRELAGRSVGLVRGYAGMRRAFDNNVPVAHVVEYADTNALLDAVARKEVDAGISDLLNASYLVKTRRLGNLRLGGVFAESPSSYMGVSKAWPELLTIINKVLDNVDPAERRRISNRWVALETPARPWWTSTDFRVAAGIAAIGLLIFVVMWFNNRRLSRELAARRQVQAELEQTRDKLERASLEKNELMHMLAHDLRSPLTGIQLGVELLQFDPPPSGDDLKFTVGQIKDSVGKMARLINDLISARNLEEGRFALNFSAGDAGQVAGAAVAAVRATAAHKGISVAARLPARAVALTTDFVALQQVVDNLLSNALKYSPADTAVEVVVMATATHCRFEVRDQGPGVPPAEREKIFEKFNRGSAQPTEKEESTGLGLWIVRRFVTALHGKVWCEAGPGSLGSVFVVEVPLLPQTA